MNLHAQIERLAAQALRSPTEGLAAQQAAWKPDLLSWSVVEVVDLRYAGEW